jgi:hypothetical protein
MKINKTNMELKSCNEWNHYDQESFIRNNAAEFVVLNIQLQWYLKA